MSESPKPISEPLINDCMEWIRRTSGFRAHPDNTHERIAYYTGVSLSTVARWAASIQARPSSDAVLRRILWLKRSSDLLLLSPLRLLSWVPNHHNTPDHAEKPPQIERIKSEPLRGGQVVRTEISFVTPVPFGLCVHVQSTSRMGILASDSLDDAFPFQWFPGSPTVAIDKIEVLLHNPDWL